MSLGAGRGRQQTGLESRAGTIEENAHLLIPILSQL
jgi:hypothetical protein